MLFFFPIAGGQSTDLQLFAFAREQLSLMTGLPPQRYQIGIFSHAPVPCVDLNKAKLLFSYTSSDTTPVSTVRTHSRMFQTLATRMEAEWEPLGRALGLRDADLYTIRRDNGHSVVEQAVQMFRYWMERNGSRATFGVLATTVYNTGMQYWNLLENINEHAPLSSSDD